MNRIDGMLVLELTKVAKVVELVSEHENTTGKWCLSNTLVVSVFGKLECRLLVAF